MITNRAIRAVTVSGIAVFLLWNGVPVWGQEAVSPVRNPQSAMEEIDRKIEELQQQKESLQRQAEQLEVLTDLQNQARDRRDEMGGELNEIANAEETTCPAAKAQREARKLHLETQIKAIADILAAKEGTDAQRKLLDRIRALCKENMVAREAQLKAAKATASNVREIEKLVEQFRNGH